AGQHVLDRGERDEAAVRLAQRGQVTDLAHRDQPLVGPVALGHRPEQVDLFVRGREPGQVELPQPVHLQPVGDLRVDAADQLVLGESGSPSAFPLNTGPLNTGPLNTGSLNTGSLSTGWAVREA